MNRSSWEPAEPAPALPPREVHVWQVDLKRVGERPLAWLSDRERARLEGSLNSSRRGQHARARGVLRELLGAYQGTHPAAVEIVEDAGRKPRLSAAAPGRAVDFSVSHSRALAVFAFAREVEVGVDVEVDRDELATATIARRLMGERRARQVQALGQREARRLVLRAWTRREAAMKLRLDTTEAHLRDGGCDLPPHLLEVAPAGGAIAALAIRRGPGLARAGGSAHSLPGHLTLRLFELPSR